MPAKEKIFTARKSVALTPEMKRAIEEKPYPSSWIRGAIQEKLARENQTQERET